MAIKTGFKMADFMQKHGERLEEHCCVKSTNIQWLGRALTAEPKQAVSYFPYRPRFGGNAEIGMERIQPTHQMTALPSCSTKPAFLINIPVAHRVNAQEDKKVESILKMLKEESFTDNAERPVETQLAVVLGVNQIKSIDPSMNEAFKKHVRELAMVEGIPNRVLGFFWKPSWRKNLEWKRECKKVQIYFSKVYAHDEAFMILKAFCPIRAKMVRETLEGKNGLSSKLVSQIPYQKIRQTIKESWLSMGFAGTLKNNSGPVYYVTMDADCRGLRGGDKGYFSRFEEVIARSEFIPSVVSFGYQLGEDAYPIPRLAVRCDMAVRDAMNKHIPGSVYCPEPGTGYYLSKGKKLVENLQKFSFIADKPGQDKRTFESRRAINNGISEGILTKSQIVFDSTGALLTAMPSRMASSQTCRRYEVLSPPDLKTTEVLKALRGVSQVHINPLDWAHYLYEGLPNSVKNGRGVYGALTGKLTLAFGVFDPIGLIFSYQAAKGCSINKAYNAVFGFYEQHSKAVFKAKGEKELASFDSFIKSQFVDLCIAKKRLKEADLTDEWVNKVVLAARDSGMALFKALKGFDTELRRAG